MEELKTVVCIKANEKNPEYRMLYDAAIGLLSKEEQAKLESSKVIVEIRYGCPGA